MTLTTQTHSQEPSPNELVIGCPGNGKSFLQELTASAEREGEAQ